MNKETVNHPSHYQSKAGLEVIDIIKAFTADLEGEEAFCTGNVIKYICRWKSKNGVEDLKKAKWYLDRLIKQVEENESEYCVILMKEEFAYEILAKMKTLLFKYGYVSVYDIHLLCGINPENKELDNYYWTNLDGAYVSKYHQHWCINLPYPNNKLKKESK